MGRPQQRARIKKQSNQVKISGLRDCPKSIDEFLFTKSHDHGAFQANFGMFLKKYKDESNKITIKLKHEQRLDFAMRLASALFDDKEIVPKLAMVKWVDDLLEDFDGAKTLMSHLGRLSNRDETVRDCLVKIHTMDKVNFKASARRALIGSIVTTRYNNKTHKIVDTLGSSISSTAIAYRGKQVSVSDYFKRRYDIDIKDPKQPLLVSSKEKILVPELSFTEEPRYMAYLEREVKRLVASEEGLSAYCWLTEQLDLDLAEYKVFREGLRTKKKEKWDKLVEQYSDKFSGTEVGVKELAAQERDELAKIQKEMEDIVARYKTQNKDIDVVVNYIEGKSLGAVPKKNKEKSVKSNNIQDDEVQTPAVTRSNNKKRRNPEVKCKDGDANANNESLIHGDIIEAAYQEGESGYEGNNNRKKLDKYNKNNSMQESIRIKEFAELEVADSIKTEQFKSDLDSINIGDLKVLSEISVTVDEQKETVEVLNVTKEQMDETNGLREEQLKNSQLNLKLTSTNQNSDLLREPLREMSRSDPNEIREEVRDRYIKDIVEVNEKIENLRQEIVENAEIKAKELEDLKTKQDEEKRTLDEESGREKWEVQEDMEKLKQEMSRVTKRMGETEAKWDRKKKDMSGRHTEESEAVKKKYTDEESQKILANLMKTSAQLTDDMKKLDIDPNVVKQVDDAREMLECPICMEMMSPPTRIWMCSGSHCVCENCKSLLTGNLCPTCRSNKVNIRALIAENLARALFKQ